jgi:hypothetical protein
MPGKTKKLEMKEEDFKHKEGMRTMMDAFNTSSYYRADPKIGFGTGSRPPLNVPGGT